MNNSKVLGEASVLARFYRRPMESFQDFTDQIKALSEADKLELARGAARELGLSQDHLAFPL